MNAQGVYPILPTPFDAHGRIDEASLRRLIDFQVAAGVQGVAILGFLGEAHKLAEDERRAVVRTVVEQADRRIDVWVGVRAFGTAGAIEQGKAAQELGADAVFVAPIGVQNDDVLFDFYQDVAGALQVPVIIHDFPASFGTMLSAELVARLGNEVEGVQAIKLEDPPVLQKLSRILELAPGTIDVFGGLGGEYFLEELQRGAKGIMTGFAFPEVLVGIHRAFAGGDEARATELFDRYCPLIRYEFQPKIGLAFRKHIYRRRGIIDTTHVRKPGMTLDARTEAELEAIVHRVGLRLQPEPQVV
ncbi:MAG: dihydrodipicolinate synthase family protein [Trueperaceae bacterium]|nr:dihydrodipicolinate synthase family protein [Trueperaceae bacterium]